MDHPHDPAHTTAAALTAPARPGRRAALILALQGLLLLGLGLLGFALADFAPKAMSSVISGGASCVLLLFCAALTASTQSRRRAIGAHAGMGILALLTVVFAWVAYGRVQKTLAEGLAWHEHYTVWLLGGMALSTALALVLVIAQRPPKSQRV